MSVTSTTVSLTSTDATGGSTPYTYQWYRSTDDGFTPGPSYLLTGKTSLSLLDSGLSPSTAYYYVLGYTDAATNTVYSSQIDETTANNTVYLKDSGPANFQICGAVQGTNSISVTTCGTPSGAQLQTNPHGLDSTCGISKTCRVMITAVVSDGGSGTCPSISSSTYRTASNTYVDGIRTVKYIGPHTLEVYDNNVTSGYVGGALTWTGQWCSGEMYGFKSSPQIVSEVNGYTLGIGPLGYLDGPDGQLMRRLALAPGHGIAASSGVVVSNAPGKTCGTDSLGCVITINTANGYDPTDSTTPKIAVAAGQKFSVFGTATKLDSVGVINYATGGQTAASCAGTATDTWPATQPFPYTVASVTSSTIVSTPFTCSTLTTGDYTSKVTTCGPTGDGTQNGSATCTRVSFIAHTGNPAWYSASGRSVNWWRGRYYMDNPSSDYKLLWDGGSVPGQGNATYGLLQQYSFAALASIVDPMNPILFRDVKYAFNNFDNMLMWMGSEQVKDMGWGDYLWQANYVGAEYLAWIVMAYAPYASNAEAVTAHNKTYNDTYDPTNTATKTNIEVSSSSNIYGVIMSGTSHTAPSGNTIELAVGATCPVANEEINLATEWPYTTSATAWRGVYGIVQSCTPGGGGNGPVVTVVSWSAGTPSSPVDYVVFATARASTTTAGAVATWTITPSSVTTATLSIAVGDMVTGISNWPVGGLGCKVTALSSPQDNTFQCRNGDSTPSSLTSTSATLWHFPQIAVSSSSVTASVGNVGYLWWLKHWGGELGAQAALYGLSGGYLSSNENGGAAYSNNQIPSILTQRLALDLAFASGFPSIGDARPLYDISKSQAELMSDGYAFYSSYLADGFPPQGSQYGDWMGSMLGEAIWVLSQSIPTLPSLNGSGAWLSHQAYYKMLLALPDFQSAQSAGSGQYLCQGQACSNAYFNVSGEANTGSTVTDSNFWFSPSATITSQFRNWLNNIMGSDGSLSATLSGPSLVVYMDPRPGASGSTYQTIPKQYTFYNTNYSTVASTTGETSASIAAISPNVKGLAMLSRTDWNNKGGSHPDATVVLHNAQSFASGGHVNVGSSEVKLYKYGPLLGVDLAAEVESSTVKDYSVVGGAMRFGTPATWQDEFNGGNFFSPDVPGSTTLVRSIGYPTNSGDSNSRWAGMCADTAGAYQSVLGVTYNIECVTHSKVSAHDEWLIWGHEAATSVSQNIQHSIHFPQNGQLAGAGSVDQPYNTGTTDCGTISGSAFTQTACSGLDATQVIRTLECTGASCPPSRYGLITQVFSPGTVTLHWDCTYGGGNAPQCTPAHTYSGGLGYSDRVTVASATPPSCTAGYCFEDITLAKVMVGATDTTWYSRLLAPDTNWTGVDACGANSGVAYIQARGNSTHGAPTSYATGTGATLSCATLPYDYYISGLTAGTYHVYLGASEVTGSPFTVASGDNSIEFSTTGAGTISFGSAPATTSTQLGGSVKAAGNVVIR